MQMKAVATRTLVQAGVVALVGLTVLLVLRATDVFLLIFGGILIAILFHQCATWLSKKTRLPHKVSLVIAITAPLLLLGLGIWLIAPAVSAQAAELVDRVPRVVTKLQEQVQQYDWFTRLQENFGKIKNALPDGSGAADALGQFFSSTFGALGNLVFALAIGLFLAISPAIYIDGVLHLVPIDKRARARKVLEQTGSTLGSWLLAKIIAMLCIGVLTTVGLWFIGIDLALALGAIAALFSFVPNIGPVAALIPAALVALMAGPQQVLYVVILYMAVQAVESYVITPLLQQRMADLPPALTISVQVLLGVLAGIVGLIVATPLIAAAMVMVKMWYVEDLLGDRSLVKQ